MATVYRARRSATRPPVAPVRSLSLALALLSAGACATATSSSSRTTASSPGVTMSSMSTAAPSPDPRIGLRAGLMDAAEATWNMRVVSKTPPPDRFVGSTNSDLAFLGRYVIQGNYIGFQVWDISNPSHPALTKGYYCPASQSDVSAYRNLLFV